MNREEITSKIFVVYLYIVKIFDEELPVLRYEEFF